MAAGACDAWARAKTLLCAPPCGATAALNSVQVTAAAWHHGAGDVPAIPQPSLGIRQGVGLSPQPSLSISWPLSGHHFPQQADHCNHA